MPYEFAGVWALAQEHIVAVGLLTDRDLERLGSGFKRCFPVSDDGKFEDLLRAIDEADAAAGLRSDREHQRNNHPVSPQGQR
ncbi:hypothetical protein FHS95_003464 [Sphingomonas naasensis]|uniref:Uncharacterized protein n=1 Tax=Sphingomonas naasensis TaxID=1344951 RepID=A0A4S1WFA9_9SPHN|nr:hypothetical protein [Sphingomonas naasensis]NIJ21753.1 hypothetical protein [Sphingomonas naasensis]TGX40835.1 hypothetical protein E5A74_15265 [Sphingomonas naasensis]